MLLLFFSFFVVYFFFTIRFATSSLLFFSSVLYSLFCGVSLFRFLFFFFFYYYSYYYKYCYIFLIVFLVSLLYHHVLFSWHIFFSVRTFFPTFLNLDTHKMFFNSICLFFGLVSLTNKRKKWNISSCMLETWVMIMTTSMWYTRRKTKVNLTSENRKPIKDFVSLKQGKNNYHICCYVQ